MKRCLCVCLFISACGPALPPADQPVAVVDVEKPLPETKPEKTAEEIAKDEARERARAIASELAELDVETLGALGATPLDDALVDGAVPTGLLDSNVSSSSGLGGTGGVTLGTVPTKNPPKPPKGIVQTQKVKVSGGAVANAGPVIARMRGRFRACYRQLLRTAPQAEGSAKLVAQLGPKGQVQAVSATSAAALKTVTPCFKAVVRGSAFSPPSGGSASTITILLKLERK